MHKIETAVISEDFTFDNVRKIAHDIANHLVEHSLAAKPLVVGYDSRFLSDKFATEVVKVMGKFSIDCFLTESDTPTPAVAWAAMNKKTAGAVMITGADKPSQFSGIRYIPSEISAPLHKMERGRAKRRGEVERFNPRDRYLLYISSLIDVSVIKKIKPKIVVDPMYGSGRGYLDLILQSFGCAVEEIHAYHDVLFGGGSPEPIEVNLEELKAKVVESRADIGLALSGDAGAFGVIDSQGAFSVPVQKKKMVPWEDGILGALLAVEDFAKRQKS